MKIVIKNSQVLLIESIQTTDKIKEFEDQLKLILNEEENLEMLEICL